MKEELSIEEAAEFLGLEDTDMLDYIAEGGGPHYMMGIHDKPIYRLNQLVEFRDKVYAESLK